MSNLTNSSNSKDIRIWENVKIFVKKIIVVSAILNPWRRGPTLVLVIVKAQV